MTFRNGYRRSRVDFSKKYTHKWRGNRHFCKITWQTFDK